MGVALIAWGRFPTADGNATVPCPTSDPPAPYLWDWLATQLHELRQIGFKAIQLPPSGKAQGGNGAGCDGYGVFDPYDQGSKDQQGSVPTRYGTFESLRRLVAIAHANDMQIYLDVVLHQRIGANAGAATYRFAGANGVANAGRWPMNPGCFRGQTVTPEGAKEPVTIAEDDVPNQYWDISFGDEVSYQHCIPARYTIEQAINWGDWLFGSTGADGMRIDDVKGMWAPFVAEFVNSGRMAGKLAYAEYFDGAGAIMSWAGGAPMNWRCLVEDFPTKFAIQYSCNGDSTWSMNSGGIADFNGPIAVTFVDNPDTDTSAGEQTIQAKLLGYVELLTKPGYPFVYGKDYFPSSVWPGAYGLKPWIDTLVGIHENLMFGDPQVLYLDGSVRVKMSHGYPGLLTGMNFDTYNNRTVTVWTTFGAGVQLHDYSGHHPDIWTDGEGRATFEIPCNAYNGGQGYVCFSRGGYWEVGEIPQRPTTQVFYGADDLDIPGIGLGSTQVGRIYVAAGSDISARLKVTGRSKTLTITADIVGPRPPDGPTPFSSVVPAGRTVMFFGSGKATETGWHDLQIECLTTGPTVPFELEVTYTAPQTLELNGTTAPWSVEIPQKPGQEPNDVTPT